MKKTIIIALLIVATTLPAQEIRVHKMQKDGALERSFVLKTNLSKKVVIDCQSFITGLRIGEFENAVFYLLGIEECEELQLRIRSSLKKNMAHCIDVQEDIRWDRSCY